MFSKLTLQNHDYSLSIEPILFTQCIFKSASYNSGSYYSKSTFTTFNVTNSVTLSGLCCEYKSSSTKYHVLCLKTSSITDLIQALEDNDISTVEIDICATGYSGTTVHHHTASWSLSTFRSYLNNSTGYVVTGNEQNKGVNNHSSYTTPYCVLNFS